MKLVKNTHLVFYIVVTVSSPLFANAEHVTEKTLDPKLVAEEIYKKCLSNGSSLVEQEVCKSRRPAIEQCVMHESSLKDAKTAKAKCELLYIAPTKK